MIRTQMIMGYGSNQTEKLRLYGPGTQDAEAAAVVGEVVTVDMRRHCYLPLDVFMALR